MKGESSTSLTRALAILEVLGSPEGTRDGGIGVVQIARITGHEKSSVSRTLKTLADAGFVLRDPDTLRYRLGWRLFTLAVNAADQNLLALAPQVLRRLVARVKESAHLSAPEGRGLLTLLSESPAWAIHVAPWIGRVAPVHCTSAGRVLLFDHTDSEVRTLLEGVDLASAGGPNAPKNVEDMLTRLHQARQLGYAVVDEEFEAGHIAVAAPVRDFRGRVIAAVNISAPKFRLGGALAAASLEVKAAAQHLTQKLTAVSQSGPAAAAPVDGSNNHRRIS